MFFYSKSESDTAEAVSKLYMEIVQSLKHEGVVGLSSFFNESLRPPALMSEIVPAIESLTSEASQMASPVISKCLNIRCFGGMEEGSAYFMHKDCIVYDGILFMCNPLSKRALAMKERGFDDGIEFSDIGYISSDVFQSLSGKLSCTTSGPTMTEMRAKLLFLSLLDEIPTDGTYGASLELRSGLLMLCLNINGQSVDKCITQLSLSNFSYLTRFILKMYSTNKVVKNKAGKEYAYSISEVPSKEGLSAISYISIHVSPLKFDSPFDINLDKRSMTILKSDISLPYGLIVLSSKVTKKRFLYNIMNFVKNERLESKIYSIENVITSNVEGVCQYELKSGDLLDKLDYSGYDIVFVESVVSDGDIDFLSRLASSGKLVFLGHSATTSMVSFASTVSSVKNKELFSSSLSGFLHMDSIPRLCGNCMSLVAFMNDNNFKKFSELSGAPSLSDKVGVSSETGCYKCNAGVSGEIVLSEYLTNDSILTENINVKIDIDNLKMEKMSHDWVRIFEKLAVLLSSQEICTSSIVKNIGVP
jgi:hypothetical protein